MTYLQHENEVNAVICSRLFVEIHKNYRQFRGGVQLQETLNGFLEFVFNMYKRLPEMIIHNFSRMLIIYICFIILRTNANPPGKGASTYSPV